MPPRRSDNHPSSWADFPFSSAFNVVEACLEIQGVNYAHYERLRELDVGRRKAFDNDLHHIFFGSLSGFAAPQDLWLAIVPGIVNQMLLKFTGDARQPTPPLLLNADWSIKVYLFVRCPRSDEQEIRMRLQDDIMTTRTANDVQRLYTRSFGVDPASDFCIQWGFFNARNESGRSDASPRGGRGDDNYGRPSPRRRLTDDDSRYVDIRGGRPSGRRYADDRDDYRGSRRGGGRRDDSSDDSEPPMPPPRRGGGASSRRYDRSRSDSEDSRQPPSRGRRYSSDEDSEEDDRYSARSSRRSDRRRYRD